MRLPFSLRLLALCAALTGFTSQASAQETTTYQYDVHGRVTSSSRSGGPSNGVSATYTYDAASNRTNVTVTGSPNGNGNGLGDGAAVGPKQFVVVPLNGYSLIFIN